MRRGKANRLSWCYDFGLLPESREMLLVARHQIVRSGNVGAFQEHIVIGVACHFETSGGSHGIAAVLNELKQLLAKTLANPQFRPRKYLPVFLQDGTRNIQAGRLPSSPTHSTRCSSACFLLVSLTRQRTIKAEIWSTPPGSFRSRFKCSSTPRPNRH